MPIKYSGRNLNPCRCVGGAIFMKKILLFLALGVFTAYSLFSQSVPRRIAVGEEDWRLLNEAKDLFYAQDFGGALNYAEKSRASRQQECTWQAYVLENALKKKAVRLANDNLTNIIAVFKKDGMTDELQIVRRYFDKFGEGLFKNSYSALIEFVVSYIQYPEADSLIGNIYIHEGEYTIASDYLKRALKNSINLDIPDEKYGILYDLASLSKDTGNFDDYEAYLLLAAGDNKRFMDENFMRSMLRIISEDTDVAVKKFFELYRAGQPQTLRAFVELGDFYLKKGEEVKALRCNALAAIISVTKLEEVLERRVTDYSFTTFSDAFVRCADFEDMVNWGNESGVWNAFVNLADSAASAGYLLFARKMYGELSVCVPESYWRKVAAKRLVD